MSGPFRVEFAVIDGDSVYEVVGPSGRYELCRSQTVAEDSKDIANAAWSAAGGPALVEMLMRCNDYINEYNGDVRPSAINLRHELAALLALHAWTTSNTTPPRVGEKGKK